MKIGAIIQARMGSTRLPGKVMKEIKGKTVLSHVIERVRKSRLIDEIIIATTIHPIDNVIVTEAEWCGASVFRGSEDDVLSRYYYATEENQIDVVVRITSDCPLIDPYVIDDSISSYLNNDYDIVTNASADLSLRTFPRGLDVEVFSYDTLRDAFINAKEKYQREHVTPYIYENSTKTFYNINHIDYSEYRLTLDTEEDFQLISKIYDCLYNKGNNFYLDEIVELFNQEPNLYLINAHVEQKKINS